MTPFLKYLHLKSNNSIATLRTIVAVLVFAFVMPFTAYSNDKDGAYEEEEMAAYEEVPIIVNVPRIGNTEISALIFNEEAYLSIKELFNFLKIKSAYSSDIDSVSGFFIDVTAPYLVDKAKSRIIFQGKTFYLKEEDLIKTETNLYLKASYFGQVFGLDCSFNFRSLSITLNAKIELPAIREMQQELIRKNLSKLKGVPKADTTILSKRGVTGFGIADWSVISTQQSDGKKNTRFDLGLGAMVAGGETHIGFLMNTNSPFDLKQQYYRWRYVNNNSSFLKQVIAGKIFPQSTSTLYSNVVGVQFTNAPATYRKSFGSYRLNSTTEPGWLVELYVNNVLVNYVKADASGFFSFDVPLVYGSSVVKLRFYGPWGEERVREENVSIPFNFLPAKQFEYTHSTGMVEDGQKSLISRTAFNYGINNQFTMGAGVEYLASVVPGKTMPFVNASYRIKSNLLFSADYTYGVKAKGVMSYRLPSNLQIDAEYHKYHKTQQAIRFNYVEERRLVMTKSFRGKSFSALSRLTLNQQLFLKGERTTGEFLLSAITPKFSANITTFTSMYNKYVGEAYSNVSFSFRLPANIRFQPQVRYQYNTTNVSYIRLEAEKMVFQRGYLNMSYENNFINQLPGINIGFRYDLSFAQTQVAVQKNKLATTTMQSARGSLWFDKGTKKIEGSNRANIGRGALVIVPFIDENGNNIRDKNEHKAFGLQVRLNGGFREQSEDSTVHITGLEAYRSYFVELDDNGFDNISWRIAKKTLNVEIVPNYTKSIEVPIEVLGEASGSVYIQRRKSKKGLGQIMISVYDSNSVAVAKVVSEADGYFNYLGLQPGSYVAKLSKAQLDEFNFHASVTELPFTINRAKDGDVVDGLEFVLTSPADSLKEAMEEERQRGIEQARLQNEERLKQEHEVQEAKLLQSKQQAVREQTSKASARQKMEHGKALKKNFEKHQQTETNVRTDQSAKAAFGKGQTNTKQLSRKGVSPGPQKNQRSIQKNQEAYSGKNQKDKTQEHLRNASRSKNQQGLQPAPFIIGLQKFLNDVEKIVREVPELVLQPEATQHKPNVRKR